MTDQDVAVATPPNNEDPERPDRSIAEQLGEQARTDGVDLVGPGGLSSNLTKQVLETGLEVEMEEHLGYENTRRKVATAKTHVTAPDRKR
jgi:transposase-like protein